MEEKPVLTISILCSGRQETRRCLNSLRSLRERVPCELILVDTGCDMEMRRLLSSYADKVIPFAWCDDFAKARNAGLEKARGEWFLYLDDDERFINTDAIETFFLSGAYKEYYYAGYTVRNFFNAERTNYQDSFVARMYSLQGKGRFQGIVHEHFEPLQEPAKILSSIAEHTGYIHADRESKKRHSERNIRLLKKAMAEKNDDTADLIRLRAHLAQEYLLQKDYKKLLTFCGDTLAEFEMQDDNNTNRHRGCFYCGEILAEMQMGEAEGALRAYRRAVSDRRNTGYTTAYLMTQGAELFRRNGEKEKLEECVEKYLELWDYYREKPEERFAEQTFLVMSAFYDEVASRMFCFRICMDLEKGNTSSLRKYFDSIGWDKEMVYITEDFIPALVKAMARLPYEDIFSHAAKVLTDRPGMDIFRDELGKIEKEEELSRLTRIFGSAEKAEKPVLTISMLCGGRAEIKKSLDSLKMLRRRVPCELILVDTGCNAELKKYLQLSADLVVPFTWCDDFAKARNAGLEKAKGEWFMFLDDDEWFLDTKEIEDFFVSGTYKNYGSAQYILRNYMDKERLGYEDAYLGRLTSLRERIQFQGVVHEVFEPALPPVKRLFSVAEHFGYVYRTPEEKEKRMVRNLAMLQKALEEDEENIRMWTQLAQQYRAMEDYRELRTCCGNALRKFNRKEDSVANRYRGTFYCGLMEACICLGDYEAAQTVYEAGIADRRNTDYCRARLYTMGEAVFEQKGDTEEAEECCLSYLALWDHYRTREDELFAQNTLMVNIAFHMMIKNQMFCHQICRELGRGSTASLGKYFDGFGWDDNAQVCMTAEFMPALARAMAELPFEEIFVHAADIIVNRAGANRFWDEIEKVEKEEELGRLIAIFSEITGETAAQVVEKLKAKQEMHMLATQIKAQVRALLAQGMKKEALQILEQLKTFVPGDAEVEEQLQEVREVAGGKRKDESSDFSGRPGHQNQ